MTLYFSRICPQRMPSQILMIAAAAAAQIVTGRIVGIFPPLLFLMCYAVFSPLASGVNFAIARAFTVMAGPSRRRTLVRTAGIA
jgi:hypothetical protein